MFLAFVAGEVRAGRLKVHAFCLMLNHYHLLVDSKTDERSEAIANFQRECSRQFASQSTVNRATHVRFVALAQA